MKNYLKAWAFFSLLSIFVFSGCSRRSETGIGTEANPAVIALSAPYAEKLSTQDITLLQSELSSESGLSVKVEIFPNSVSIIDAIGVKKADLAFLTLDEYLLAREEFRAEPVLRVLRGPAQREYSGIIIAADKDVKTVKDLQGKKVAMSNPYSVSGFFLPSFLFKENGVKVVPVFTGSHDLSMKKLLEGEVSAAAVYGAMTEKYNRLGVIFPTETVPNEPVTVRKGLDPYIKEKLVSAILAISGGKNGAAMFSRMADITGFEKVGPQIYSAIHAKILSSGDIYSIVPEGIKIRRLNEPYYYD